MRSSVIVLAGFAWALLATSVDARPRFIDVQLVAQSLEPKAGKSTLLAFRMTPQPGWHGYWSNPGGSGLAPVVKWTAPAGLRFGRLRHPAPTLLRLMGVTSYVHSGPYVLISRVSLDRGLEPGTVLPVKADLSWAACSDKLCVPESASLSLELRVGDGKSSPDASQIKRAAAAEPRQVADGRFQASDGWLILEPPYAAALEGRPVRFFPDENGIIDPLKVEVLPGPPLRIAAPFQGTSPRSISGVLTDGTAAFRVRFKQAEFAGAADAMTLSSRPLEPATRVTARTAKPETVIAPSSARPGEKPAGKPLRWPIAEIVGSAVLVLALAILALVMRKRAGKRRS